MSDLLAAASNAMGIPAPLVQRAAAARAADADMSVDDVLSAWSGGGGVPVAQAAPAESAPAAAAESASAEPAAAGPEPEAATVAATQVGAAPVVAAAAASTRAPAPTEVGPREAARLPEVITVPTAGIRERTNSTIPKWLTTLLLAVPLFALFALGGFATGECGSATELQTNVVTGEIVNCDGTEFTGSGGSGGGLDFVAIGERIYQGGEVTGVNCFSCHGAQGQGIGTFPGMGGVRTTFSSCTDHIEWVTLGADGFRAQGRPTYGDTQRPVNAMPSFQGRLSDEEIAMVVAFERVRFGGGDATEVGIDCGLIDPEGEDGGEGTEEDDASDAGEAAGAAESRSGADS